MDPATAAGLTSAGGSVMSSLISGLFNSGSARRANKRMVDFWNMQNEYNHPKAQMARLKEAGLNPNLIYGDSASGATGLAGDIGKPERAEIDFQNPLHYLTRFADLELRKQQTNNAELTGDVLVQDAAQKAAQTAYLGTQNAKTSFDLGLAQDLRQNSMDAAKESLRQQRLQNRIFSITAHIADRTKEATIRQKLNEAANSIQILEGQKLTNALRQKELELKEAGLENSGAILRWLYRTWQDVPDHIKEGLFPSFQSRKFVN